MSSRIFNFWAVWDFSAGCLGCLWRAGLSGMSGLSAAHAMCKVVTWGIVAGVAGLCAVRAHRGARAGACRRSRSFSSSRGAGILLTDVEELVVDGHFGVRTTAALQMVLTEGGVP
eukprot:2169977-Prymnesium_polylepis.1